MSIAQVKDKFPSAVRPEKIDKYGTQFEIDNNLSNEALLEIPDYKVENNTFNVQFLFKSDALDAVRLTSVGGSPAYSFGSVRTLLKTKYGEPIDTSVNNRSQTITWHDKGTTIDLTYYTNSYLFIWYQGGAEIEANKL